MKLKELFEILGDRVFIYLYDTKGNEITKCLYESIKKDKDTFLVYTETIDKYRDSKVLEINALDLDELRIKIDYDECDD